MKFNDVPEPSDRWTTAIAVSGNFTTVQRGDLGVVPLRDLTDEDVGEELGVQPKLTGLEPRDVEDRHDAADDDRKLNQALRVELFRLEGRVGGAEIDRLPSICLMPPPEPIAW